MAKDPVCGMDVEEEGAEFQSAVAGRNIIFVPGSARRSLRRSRRLMWGRRRLSCSVPQVDTAIDRLR
jgi:hypothetical protein